MTIRSMTTAGDKQIWRMAAELGTAIVTKDEDFVHLRGIDPAGPVVV